MKTKDRTDQTAEFFTPDELVNELIEQSSTVDQLKNSSYSVLDPACGSGQFIIGILKEKVRTGLTKDEALKETYGVDLMASNIADLIARIVFWKEWDIDIFDESGSAKKELELDGYADDDSACWLKEYVESGNKYSRVYKFENYAVTVRNHPEKWWVMQYYIGGSKEYTGGSFCNNFVVGDGLKYDYEFNDEPSLKTEQEILLETIEVNLKLKDTQVKELLGIY